MTLSAPLFTVALLVALVTTVSGSRAVVSTRDEGIRSSRELIIFQSLGPDLDEPGSQRFVLRNDSSLVVRYYGYDPRTPNYSLATRVHGGWRYLGRVYCGTGSGLQRLEPGAAIEFSLKMHERLRGPLRFAITVTAGDDLTDEWPVFAIVSRASLAGLSN